MTQDLDKKVEEIFCDELGIDIAGVNDAMAYDSLKGWDSLKHLMIVSRLEEEFGIELDVDDIIAMSTLGKIKEIVTRYVHKKG
jgi:acyl carrier protein